MTSEEILHETSKTLFFFFAGLNGGIQPIYTCSYGHLLVISTTYNPIYRMYNPIYNQL